MSITLKSWSIKICDLFPLFATNIGLKLMSFMNGWNVTSMIRNFESKSVELTVNLKLFTHVFYKHWLFMVKRCIYLSVSYCICEI